MKTKRKLVTCMALVETVVTYCEDDDRVIMLDYESGNIVSFEGPAEALAGETGKDVSYGDGRPDDEDE